MHVPMSVHVPCKYLRLVRQGVIKVVILKELVVNNEMYIIVHFFLIMEFECWQSLGRVVSCIQQCVWVQGAGHVCQGVGHVTELGIAL